MKDEIINLCGIDVWVKYDYEEGEIGSYFQAPEPDYFEIKEVYVAYTEWDITSQLTDHERELIKDKLLRVAA